MRSFLYYTLLLLLGWAWYRFGQKQLRKGRWDDNGQPTQGIVGPVGLLVAGVVASYLAFALVRALWLGEVPCVGRGCTTQVYTLAAHASEYCANLFFIAWMVLGLGYAVYVTLKMWFRN